MESVISILPALLGQGPLYLIWLAGILLAIVRWQQHPRISRLVVIGLGIMLAETIVGTLITVTLPMWANQSDWSASQIGAVFSAIGILRALIATAGWVCILMAIFVGRNR